jgi:outer membrane protein assembly factor BamD (BamD/ComL family)
MKKFSLALSLLTLVVMCGALSSVRAQGAAKAGPNAAVVRDAELEKDSLHNLEVARHYYKLKKAYVAAIKRCEEIIAGNPNFARLDEVLYIAGESSLLLSQNRGKQDAKLPPEKLREDAREYFSQLVNSYPESSFRKQAESQLAALGGLKPKTTEAEKP